MVFDPADLLIKLVTSETPISDTKKTYAISAISPGYFPRGQERGPNEGQTYVEGLLSEVTGGFSAWRVQGQGFPPLARRLKQMK